MIAGRNAVVGILLAGVAAVGSAGSAQVISSPDPGLRAATHAGVGYVVNLPRQMFGLNAVVMSPTLHNWGFYVDFKRTTEPRSDDPLYEPNITLDEAMGFNDFALTEESQWESINVAIVRVMAPALALYVGAGRSEESGYRRFYDETLERGTSGVYWVSDPTQSGTRLNVLGGAWFRAHRNFLFQFGAESAPTGATVGVTVVLPFFR